MINIYKTYSFDSAHYLTKVDKDHPCSRLHGHTYTIKVTVGGIVNSNGFVMDFHDMDKIIKPVIAKYDHRLLNDFLENPTSENLLVLFKKELEVLPLISLELKETVNTGAIWIA